MAIKLFKIGPLGTNCYLFTDERTGKSAIVDPGHASKTLLGALDGVDVEYILVTHAHADHIAGLQAVKEKTSAKVVAHKNEKGRFESAAENLYVFINEYEGDYVPQTIDIEVDEGDEIKIGESVVKVLHTPGHTDGCVCYMLPDTIFVGDTIFKESYGRTDLPTGSFKEIIESITRLSELDGDYQLLPGHEDTTTLNHEREFNPLRRYFRGFYD